MMEALNSQGSPQEQNYFIDNKKISPEVKAKYTAENSKLISSCLMKGSSSDPNH
jgi:hypothetical protein